MDKIKCEICGRECKNLISLCLHFKSHKIKYKDYYDKYLKKEGEGICLTCGKKTKFSGIRGGYHKHCSNKCMVNDIQVKRKRINTNLKKYGAEYISQLEEVKKKK